MSKFCSIFLVGLGLAIYTETGIFQTRTALSKEHYNLHL